MRPDGVVFPPPAFDEHLGLPERVEDLSFQQLVAELAVERFDVAVLPGTARFDVERLDVDPLEPLPDLGRRELRRCRSECARARRDE